MLRYFGALKFRSRASGSARGEKFIRRLFPFSFGITREGILFISLVFLLSLAAINTGNNLLYIILASMLSTIAVSGIVSHNSLKQVSLSLQMPENVFAGEKVSIKVSMKNLKRIFPSFSILVQDSELGQGLSSLSRVRRFVSRKKTVPTDSSVVDRAMLRQIAYFPILRPGEVRSELVVQSFPRRGLYRLQGFWISTRFPFGFFRRGERIWAKGEVLVYPLIQEIPSFFHLLPFLPGRLESRHVGPGENLFSIRKYQEAESARIIDWKATAKTGELMAREFAREEESKFCLILDTRVFSPSTVDGEENFEKAVSLSASIAAYFLREGAEMEFVTPSEYIPRGAGINHLYRILRSLADIKCEIVAPARPKEFRAPGDFLGIAHNQELRRILSDKVYKIILTSMPRGSFPSTVWRSSHVVFFDEL